MVYDSVSGSTRWLTIFWNHIAAAEVSGAPARQPLMTMLYEDTSSAKPLSSSASSILAAASVKPVAVQASRTRSTVSWLGAAPSPAARTSQELACTRSPCFTKPLMMAV